MTGTHYFIQLPGFRMIKRLLFALLCLSAGLGLAPAAAATPTQTVQTAWRLLDYVAVDYGGAVQNGQVVSAGEYAEMVEFSTTVERQLQSLPATPSRASLLAQSKSLRAAISAKEPPETVASKSRKLGSDLLKAFPVPLAPTSLPDVNRGNELYRQNCSSCHGTNGGGDGPLARQLDPRPVDFTDRKRVQERSLFALEQVINQGLDGTAMPSFANLSTADRWALAFKVGSFAYADVEQGQKIWESDAELRKRIPDLATLTTVTPQSLSQQIGDQNAAALIAYLRANPSALRPDSGGSLALTRSKLAQSLAAYKRGDRDVAKRLALSAYLDGFEPVEPVLAARDRDLMRQIEGAMGELRSRIASGRSPQDVEQQTNELDGLFQEAEAALAPRSTSFASTFVSALTILLREGLEALLVVVAMIAFLRKAERPETLRYVHGGWVVALAAGGLTWLAATKLISVSGAGRELTEGFGGLFAAFVLVFVGIWMHGKAHADAWQQYVRDKMNRALAGQSSWLIFGLAFIVVYREVFETVLFYAAMWNESPAALTSGVIVGCLLLGAIAFGLLRYSRALPISQFFRYSSILMAVLAVILAGKGMAAIQEAGFVGISPIRGIPTLDVVGFHPNVQVVLVQLAVISALAIGFWINDRRVFRDANA
jgi:high-affinity iron transporter